MYDHARDGHLHIFARSGSFCMVVNLLETLDFCVAPGISQLMFPYCDQGSVFDLLVKTYKDGAIMSPASVYNIQLQLQAALIFLQQGLEYDYDTQSFTNVSQLGTQWAPIIHRAIKPPNILVRHDLTSEFPNIVLADFGKAVSLPPHTRSIFPPVLEFEWPSYSIFFTESHEPPEYRALKESIRLTEGEGQGPQDRSFNQLSPAPEFDVWQIGAVLHECAGGNYNDWKREGPVHKPHSYAGQFSDDLKRLLEPVPQIRGRMWKDMTTQNAMNRIQYLRDHSSRERGPRTEWNPAVRNVDFAGRG
ncbi:hypothetical protein EJ08DRAFT_438264 [Tothia fuscella]|uniref:Protein kinase domain-containing protein n=1 Tax=Tothia fuscella TaxID=1048955 RepID=A0A9P4U2V3_9PEZI|nr:hypothetical protein EJ08DRAFT_438264 [Tothia fuscella]